MKILRYVVLLLALGFGMADASPIAIVTGRDGITVTMHDDDCTLKTEVINLPGRITWEDNGKILEGCYSIGLPQLGYLVLAYFADKTVVLIPMSYFKKVEAA